MDRGVNLEFTVYGTPAPAGSKRGFRTNYGRIIITDANPKARPWKALVTDAACQAIENGSGGRMGLLRGPLYLECTFYLPRPKSHYGSGRNSQLVKPAAPEYPAGKPDATKLLRAVEDALNGVVWKDDAQVVMQFVVKMYGEPARCEVKIEELTEA